MWNTLSLPPHCKSIFRAAHIHDLTPIHLHILLYDHQHLMDLHLSSTWKAALYDFQYRHRFIFESRNTINDKAFLFVWEPHQKMEVSNAHRWDLVMLIPDFNPFIQFFALFSIFPFLHHVSTSYLRPSLLRTSFRPFCSEHHVDVQNCTVLVLVPAAIIPFCTFFMLRPVLISC